jgi:hypothetical protein
VGLFPTQAYPSSSRDAYPPGQPFHPDYRTPSPYDTPHLMTADQRSASYIPPPPPPSQQPPIYSNSYDYNSHSKSFVSTAFPYGSSRDHHTPSHTPADAYLHVSAPRLEDLPDGRVRVERPQGSYEREPLRRNDSYHRGGDRAGEHREGAGERVPRNIKADYCRFELSSRGCRNGNSCPFRHRGDE